MAKSKSRGARTGKQRRSSTGAGGGRKPGMHGYSQPASVDSTRHTGGSNGLKALRAGRRIGGK